MAGSSCCSSRSRPPSLCSPSPRPCYSTPTPSTAATRQAPPTQPSSKPLRAISGKACSTSARASSPPWSSGLGSMIKIATVFAAVAAFSGTDTQRPTMSTVISSARGNIWGPVLTIAFGYVLELVDDLHPYPRLRGLPFGSIEFLCQEEPRRYFHHFWQI